MFNKTLLVVVGAVAVEMGLAGSAEAATFNIVYDDTLGGGIDGNIVGTGTFSFDGPGLLGEFALSSLTNLQFSANIAGSVFDDIQTDLTQTKLLIFEDAGQTLATFTGSGGVLVGGSLDVQNVMDFLSHEPGSAGAPCCGGTDISRLYGLGSLGGPSGNYQMVLATTPEPVSVLSFLAIGAVAAGTALKNKKAT